MKDTKRNEWKKQHVVLEENLVVYFLPHTRLGQVDLFWILDVWKEKNQVEIIKWIESYALIIGNKKVTSLCSFVIRMIYL